METQTPPKCDHLWEYRWGGLYRRCYRKGCRAAEWNYNDNRYLAGRPCNISYYHTLSARACGTKKATISELETNIAFLEGILKKGPKGYQCYGYQNEEHIKQNIEANRKLIAGMDIGEIASDIEKGFFLRQKELAKKV